MSTTAEKRPNILLITSDQHRADCYGFEGRKVKTPHLDALAREGTRMAACITPNVVCQPSRASILTGLYPCTHGVSDNGIDLPAEIGTEGFAGRLSKNGYATGFIGKAHFASYFTFSPTGTPECIESTPDFAPPWHGPYMGFQHVDLMLLGHNHWLPFKAPQGQHYERWYHADGAGEEKNRLYAGRPTRTPQTFHSQLPPAWHNSTWVGNKTIDFLRERRDEPFCVWASFPDPHHPFDAPEPWSLLHHPDEVDLPVERRRDFDRRPWWHRASVETTPKLSGELLKLRAEYSRMPVLDDPQLRELIANYYGMISLIDHNVGRILVAVQELGLADNTIVVFTTDHGDWLGDHGLVLKGPMMYDGLLRVGMIVRGPGVPAGKVVADPVSTVDLCATIADYANVPGAGDTDGKTLRPLIEGDGAGRDFAYNEWDLRPGRVGVPLTLRTVRTRRYRLTVERESQEGELYDLQEDPHEMTNRYRDAGHRGVRAELEDMIAHENEGRAPVQLPVVGTA